MYAHDQFIDRDSLQSELTELNAKLREMREEARGIEEREMLGEAIDKRNLADLKADIETLRQRQAQVVAQLDGEPLDEASFSPVNKVLDFFVDYKPFIIWGGAVALLAGLMIYLSSPSEMTPEQKAAWKAAAVGMAKENMARNIQREGGVEARKEFEKAVDRGDVRFGR